MQLSFFEGPKPRRASKKSKSGRKVEPSKTRKLGAGRRPGTARVWLEGKILEHAGFSVGDQIHVAIDHDEARVTIRLDPTGGRVVSEHRGKPVVDVMSKALKEAMRGAEEIVVEHERGRIVVRPWEKHRLVVERERRADGTVGSAFTGAGFMDLAAEQAGYFPRFGVELERKFALMYGANNDRASVINLPVQEALAQNRRARGSMIPNVELLLMGIPCQPWSKMRGGGDPAEHDLYSMTFYALGMVEACNPLNVVIEQVPGYVKDPVFAVLKAVLEEKGYHVTSKIVDSHSLGYAAGRPRAYVVATTKPGFSWKKALVKRSGLSKVRDVLLPPSSPHVLGAKDTQGGWFSTKDRSGIGKFMREAWARPSWRPSFMKPGDTRIPTIVGSYYDWTATGPFVKHPTKKDVYRLLTIEEIRRAHGVPSDYELPGSVSAQAAALGQAVIVPLVQGIVGALPGGAPRRTVTAKHRRLRNPPWWSYSPNEGVAWGV